MKFFNYKIVTEEGEGEEKKTITKRAGVNINNITSYLVNEEILHIFMDREIEDLKPVRVPIKVKVSKESPNGWSSDVQMRNVKEPFYVQVTDKEDTDRFLKYMESLDIAL